MAPENKRPSAKKRISDAKRQAAMKKYNIKFHAYLPPEDWPRSVHSHFSAITELGGLKYDAWRKDVNQDTTRPWRTETKDRAVEIAEIAVQCRQDLRNETEWRHELEDKIFRRFKLEVTCPSCTGRLWRSEIEVKPTQGDSDPTGLLDRQNKRIVCYCPRYGPNKHKQELKRLFDCRRESYITYDAALQKEVSMESQKPDLVYGLRKIGSIERFLSTKGRQGGGETLDMRLKSSPFKDDILTLYPFLIHESKSEKSGYSNSGIELQMAFSLRELLLIQYNLKQEVMRQKGFETVDFEPLVWCLSHKGEDWLVYGAYITETKGALFFDSVLLWYGKITSPESSMRLLLILDYIFDWARDTYRGQIIIQLESLAEKTTPMDGLNPSQIHDSAESVDSIEDDIEQEAHPVLLENNEPAYKARELRSTHEAKVVTLQEEPGSGKPSSSGTEFTIHPLQKRAASFNWHVTHETGHIGVELQPLDPHDHLRKFKTQHHDFRDARFIQSRVMGLYVTQGNIGMLFNSRLEESVSRNLFQQIITRLEREHPILLRRETLSTIEAAWTGVYRETGESVNASDEFYVLLTFSAYLTPEWDQVRELCYLAVSVDALDSLCRLASDKAKPKKRGKLHKWSLPTAVVDTEVVIKIVKLYLGAGISANLSACIYRASESPLLKPKSEDDDEERDDIFGHDAAMPICVMTSYVGASSRGVVWRTYKYHRIGRNEPSTPYLMVSSKLDKQVIPRERDQPRTSPWPTSPITDSGLSVFAYSKNPRTISLKQHTQWCLFVLNTSKLQEIISHVLAQEEEEFQGYKTDRMGSGGWKQSKWNTGWRRISSLKQLMSNLKQSLEAAIKDEGVREQADKEDNNKDCDEADNVSQSDESSFFDNDSTWVEASDDEGGGDSDTTQRDI